MSYSTIVDGSEKFDLGKFDPDDTGNLSKSNGEPLIEKLGAEMTELQDLMYEAGKTALLVVLQGMDTSGKDGTIRHLLKYINAQGCRVAPFKVPTPTELGHDFLWRCHSVTPEKGDITIFNRSHYEDVLVVRVHDLAPKDVWTKRYSHINNFENLLCDSNTLVVKFFLHISKDEQEKRLLAREQEVEKSWKLSVGDWKERELWDDYQKAYEDAINNCASTRAPWNVVAANKKWFRNLAVTSAINDAMRDLKSGWLGHLKEVGTAAKTELETYRKAKMQ